MGGRSNIPGGLLSGLQQPPLYGGVAVRGAAATPAKGRAGLLHGDTAGLHGCTAGSLHADTATLPRRGRGCCTHVTPTPTAAHIRGVRCRQCLRNVCVHQYRRRAPNTSPHRPAHLPARTRKPARARKALSCRHPRNVLLVRMVVADRVAATPSLVANLGMSRGGDAASPPPATPAPPRTLCPRARERVIRATRPQRRLLQPLSCVSCECSYVGLVFCVATDRSNGHILSMVCRVCTSCNT